MNTSPKLGYASVVIRDRSGDLLLNLTNEGSYYNLRDADGVVEDVLTPENAYRTFHHWASEPGARVQVV